MKSWNVRLCVLSFLFCIVLSNCASHKKISIKRIHFDYNKSFIRNDMIPIMDMNVAYFKQNRSYNITIEGHSNKREAKYKSNILGQKRAESVKEYLVHYGLNEKRIKTVSYENSKPLCKQQNKACRYLNRRVEIYTRKK